MINRTGRRLVNLKKKQLC